MKNYVAIDPSLISTAMVVGFGDEYKMFNYCKEERAMGKKGLTKWFKYAEDFVELRYVEYRKEKEYSASELVKLKDYDRVTDMVIQDILNNINPSLPTVIGIEGYSYSSSAGDIIDLVTFSTILRKKLFDLISQDIHVLSPSTLKLESCKLSYEPILKESGKKKITITEEWRNPIGVPGGKFTKTDMFYSIIENKVWNDKWYRHCSDLKSDIIGVASIPKPYEDLNDAYLIFKYLHKK